MRKLFALGAALVIASSAYAAPDVTNNTQKGSLVVLPDIIAWDAANQTGTNTIVRLSNDGTQGIDVKCYWMDSNKNRVDFMFYLTKNQTVWFDARHGDGSIFVNPMPKSSANGLGAVTGEGLLACWAVDGSGQNRVKWNHLYATAVVFNSTRGVAYEYTGYAFYHFLGTEGQVIGGGVPGNNPNGEGDAGTLLLKGRAAYDSCPLYMVGAFHPADYSLAPKDGPAWFDVKENRLAIAGCNLDLRQDWTPTWTKLQFDVWDGHETKLTGGWECANSWEEIIFPDIDSAQQVLTKSTVDTNVARYRIQGVASTQCKTTPPSVAVGILVIQSTEIQFGLTGPYARVGTNLNAGGKIDGVIKYDPADAVFEGRVR